MTRSRIPTILTALAAGFVGALMAPMLVGAGPTPGVYQFSDHYTPAEQPMRVFDSRNTVRLVANQPVTIDVPPVERSFVLSNGQMETRTEPALAAALNVTVTDPAGGGYVTIWPDGQPQPSTSTVNFDAGETEANSTIVRVTDGRVQLVSSVDTHVVLDLTGQFDLLVTGSIP